MIDREPEPNKLACEEKSEENKEILEYEKEEAPAFRGILYEHPKAKHSFVVIFFVALCVLLSLSFWFSPHYSKWLWASKEAVFEKHEYWRLFTALFTHADIKHLLSNMPLFVVFGWLLRSYFGLLAFPLAAFLVGAVTNYATLYYYPEHTRLIGASGVVYGLVGLWVTFYLRYEVRYSFRMKLFRVLGVSMVLLLPTTYSPTTSYLAHALGFLFGVLCALLLMLTGIYDKKQRALQIEPGENNLDEKGRQ